MILGLMSGGWLMNKIIGLCCCIALDCLVALASGVGPDSVVDTIEEQMVSPIPVKLVGESKPVDGFSAEEALRLLLRVVYSGENCILSDAGRLRFLLSRQAVMVQGESGYFIALQKDEGRGYTDIRRFVAGAAGSIYEETGGPGMYGCIFSLPGIQLKTDAAVLSDPPEGELSYLEAYARLLVKIYISGEVADSGVENAPGGVYLGILELDGVEYYDFNLFGNYVSGKVQQPAGENVPGRYLIDGRGNVLKAVEYQSADVVWVPLF